jgi:hypothetical protein
MTAELVYDDEGLVRGFSYHDGYLDGVVLETQGAKSAHLALRSTDGECRVLTLQDLSAFDVQNFREGNIILTMQVLPIGRISERPGADEMIRRRLHIDPERLPTGRLVFLLDASYGADVLGVCGAVSVSGIGATIRTVSEGD